MGFDANRGRTARAVAMHLFTSDALLLRAPADWSDRPRSPGPARCRTGLRRLKEGVFRVTMADGGRRWTPRAAWCRSRRHASASVRGPTTSTLARSSGSGSTRRRGSSTSLQSFVLHPAESGGAGRQAEEPARVRRGQARQRERSRADPAAVDAEVRDRLRTASRESSRTAPTPRARSSAMKATVDASSSASTADRAGVPLRFLFLARRIFLASRPATSRAPSFSGKVVARVSPVGRLDVPAVERDDPGRRRTTGVGTAHDPLAAHRKGAVRPSTSSWPGRSSSTSSSPGCPRSPDGDRGLGQGMGSCPGGIANLAVAASRLGLRTALVAAFGDDDYGDFCWRTLEKQEHVDLSLSRRFDDWHSPVTVSMSVGRDRSMVTHGHAAPVGTSELMGPPPPTRAVLVDLVRSSGTRRRAPGSRPPRRTGPSSSPTSAGTPPAPGGPRRSTCCRTATGSSQRGGGDGVHPAPTRPRTRSTCWPTECPSR